MNSLLLAGWSAWAITALFWSWGAIVSLVDQNIKMQRTGIRFGFVLVAIMALLAAATFADGFHS